MKDFAKSIYVGNAKDKNGKDLRPGDDVMVKTDDPKLNKGTVISINGDTVGVQIWHTGGSVWTTPSRLVTKIGNTRTGNSNKAEIIEKKKKEGATLKVDNGQKLEFSDGSTYVKTSFSDDYREAHNYTGNTRTGNSYNWEERRGHQELYDPTFPFGGHVRGYVEKTKNGYVGAKTNGSIVIKQKEFATEAEAKKFVENKKVGNASATLGRLEHEIRYVISEATVASRILNGNFSATNIISALSHCKECCDEAIKLAQQYDREINK